MSERTLKDLFHLVRQVIPEEQELITINPDESVSNALSIMRLKSLSQIPVVEKNEVLGVFSYRSFAAGILNLPEKERASLLTLSVEEFIEDLRFVNISDELPSLIDELDAKDAVLVGAQDRLLGIVTSIDALRYFYEVASAYVILQEIELSIRELIRSSVSTGILADCIEKCLGNHYRNNGVVPPARVEELTFNDYVMILRFKDTWDLFRPAFGGTSNIVYAKLKELPELRNDIFHFKREITIEEHNTLRERRDWLLKRIRKVSASQIGEYDD